MALLVLVRLMTLIELIIMGGAISGFLVGGSYGYSHAGVWGAVLGCVGGVVGGWVAAASLALAVVLPALAASAVGELFSRLRRARYFGLYWVSSNAAEWNAVYCRLNSGQEISGIVVLKSGSEWVVDIGVGFPAVIDSHEHPALKLGLGERFTWQVASFRHREREVVLSPVVTAESAPFEASERAD